MKKITPIITVLLMTIIGFAGCKNGKTDAATTVNDSDSIASDSDSIEVPTTPLTTDTLKTVTVTYDKYEEDSMLYNEVSVEWPTGNDTLSKCVRKFIVSQLAKTYLPHVCYFEGKPNLRNYPYYKGNLTDAKAMVKFYTKGTQRYLREVWDEMHTEYYDGHDQIDNSISIKKDKETPGFISFYTTTYSELGGPHGNYECVTTVISKYTGREVTNVLRKGSEKALQKYIRKGILDYFNLDEEGKVVGHMKDKDLDNELLPKFRGKIIPLPVNPPVLDTDGIWLEYQRDEIMPYAQAIVSIKIPFKDIKSYLTQEVCQMFDLK